MDGTHYELRVMMSDNRSHKWEEDESLDIIQEHLFNYSTQLPDYKFKIFKVIDLTKGE